MHQDECDLSEILSETSSEDNKHLIHADQKEQNQTEKIPSQKEKETDKKLPSQDEGLLHSWQNFSISGSEMSVNTEVRKLKAIASGQTLIQAVRTIRQMDITIYAQKQLVTDAIYKRVQQLKKVRFTRSSQRRNDTFEAQLQNTKDIWFCEKTNQYKIKKSC